MTVTINGATGIAGVNGSAALPAVQGDDTNTGVFYPAADTVAISTGGTERMRINASGQAAFAAGTAALPAITANGNTTTGIFFPAADTIAFAEGGAETMRINSSGQVGIGTTSPTAPLDVKVGTGNFTVGLQGTANTQLTATGVLRFDSTAGTTVFTQNTTESMRLDSSGNLLIGCTSQANPARATYQTATNNTRFIGFQTTAGAEIGYIFNNTTATQYSTTSDYRLKKDIAPMTGALAKIQALKPVTYKWKSNDSDAEGFIAHELAEICPSAVVGTKDAVNENGDPNYQGIDTSFLVATLTAAIQEQQAMITALTARITALEVTP
jgi:hypothetical protein